MEEWVEGAAVTQLCVCVCVYLEYTVRAGIYTSICLFYDYCLKGYGFISTYTVDTTGSWQSVRLPLGVHVDTAHCKWFITPVTVCEDLDHMPCSPLAALLPQ